MSLLEYLTTDVFTLFKQKLDEHGMSSVPNILLDATKEELLRQAIQDAATGIFGAPLLVVLEDMLPEIEQGDIKYGPHPGPGRAFGALRSEVYELQTELEAEDADITKVYKEAIQVFAMAYKFLRDYAAVQAFAAATLQEETRTSSEWLIFFNKGISIIDPDGWDRTNFYHSFSVERITMQEFLNRAMNSTINATQEFQEAYMNPHIEKMPR